MASERPGNPSEVWGSSLPQVTDIQGCRLTKGCRLIEGCSLIKAVSARAYQTWRASRRGRCELMRRGTSQLSLNACEQWVPKCIACTHIYSILGGFRLILGSFKKTLFQKEPVKCGLAGSM